MSQNKKYKKNKNLDSVITDEALVIAQGIKQENQTKSQTKLVAQGIRKGIELYKNQQNKRQREFDKTRKKELKTKNSIRSSEIQDSNPKIKNTVTLTLLVPWSLLIASWTFFLVYYYIM